MDIKEVLELSGLSIAEFCRRYSIPRSTIDSWLYTDKNPPPYAMKLLERCVREDLEDNDYD